MKTKYHFFISSIVLSFFLIGCNKHTDQEGFLSPVHKFDESSLVQVVMSCWEQIYSSRDNRTFSDKASDFLTGFNDPLLDDFNYASLKAGCEGESQTDVRISTRIYDYGKGEIKVSFRDYEIYSDEIVNYRENNEFLEVTFAFNDGDRGRNLLNLNGTLSDFESDNGKIYEVFYGTVSFQNDYDYSRVDNNGLRGNLGEFVTVISVE